MSCSRPVEISRYVFSPSRGGRVKRYFLVPCGHCLQCLKQRQQQIAFRAEWEALDPSNVLTLFVTLTYAPEFLPPDNELSKDEMQRFIRRLKKLTNDSVRVRYVICGEYGEQYGRAHFHALLYFDKYIDYHIISDAWSFGIVDIANFLPARAGYVAKYSVKQIGDSSVHRQEPFIMISRNVGFYFLELHGDYCRKNFIGSWENLSGYPVYLPRIFLERLFPPRDKVHMDIMLSSPAAESYFSTFAGDVVRYRRLRHAGYDARMELQSVISGYDNSLMYQEHLNLGNAFREINSITSILNRVAYETGRY